MGFNPTGLVSLQEEGSRAQAGTGGRACEDNVNETRRGSEETAPADTSALGILASRTVRKSISVVEITQSAILCYGSRRKLIPIQPLREATFYFLQSSNKGNICPLPCLFFSLWLQIPPVPFQLGCKLLKHGAMSSTAHTQWGLVKDFVHRGCVRNA